MASRLNKLKLCTLKLNNASIYEFECYKRHVHLAFEIYCCYMTMSNLLMMAFNQSLNRSRENEGWQSFENTFQAKMHVEPATELGK